MPRSFQERTSQPGSPTPIANSSLTRGLIGVYNPAVNLGQNAVTGKGGPWTPAAYKALADNNGLGWIIGSASSTFSGPVDGVGSAPVTGVTVMTLSDGFSSNGTDDFFLGATVADGSGGGGGDYNWGLYYSSGGLLYFFVKNASTTAVSAGGVTTPGLSGVHAIGGSYSTAGGLVRSYYDGVLTASTAQSGNIQQSALNVNCNRWKTNLTASRMFLGLVWNRELTASEMAQVSRNVWQAYEPVPRTIRSTTGVAPATAITLSGPGSGAVNAASTNFTVGANGTITGTDTVTPTDSSGNGTFNPTTVTINTGSPTATFTYTPTTVGARNINCTNNGSLTNPSNIAYTATGVTFTITVCTSPTDLTPRANLSGIKGRWFDNATPNFSGAPTDTFTTLSTNASGVMVGTLVNSTKTSGQVGWLMFSNSDGTPGQTPAEIAFSGPVAVD